MRSLRLLPILLAALIALPASAATDLASDVSTCQAAEVAFDGTLTADEATPALEIGSAEFGALLEAGATFVEAGATVAAADAAPEKCFYVTHYVYDLDGNHVGYLGYIADCPGTMV